MESPLPSKLHFLGKGTWGTVRGLSTSASPNWTSQNHRIPCWFERPMSEKYKNTSTKPSGDSLQPHSSPRCRLLGPRWQTPMTKMWMTPTWWWKLAVRRCLHRLLPKDPQSVVWCPKNIQRFPSNRKVFGQGIKCNQTMTYYDQYSGLMYFAHNRSN